VSSYVGRNSDIYSWALDVWVLSVECLPRRRQTQHLVRRVVTPAANAPPPARTATPGPNAFALRAAEVDAHRLRGNAFYQQATAAEDARRQDQEMASRLGLTAQ
jgi:hypothetical protein